MIMRLTAGDPEDVRRQYKVVRIDTFADVPGLILAANIENGLCLMRERVNGEEKAIEYCFGANGIRIVRRSR